MVSSWILVPTMTCCQSCKQTKKRLKVMTTNFASYFGNSNLRQNLCRHSAIIQWCLYMHHHSSGAYTTLQNSGIISMPSEQTLWDYRHFNPSTSGFSKDADLQLLNLVQQDKAKDLSKYVTLVINEFGCSYWIWGSWGY